MRTSASGSFVGGSGSAARPSASSEPPAALSSKPGITVMPSITPCGPSRPGRVCSVIATQATAGRARRGDHRLERARAVVRRLGVDVHDAAQIEPALAAALGRGCPGGVRPRNRGAAGRVASAERARRRAQRALRGASTRSRPPCRSRARSAAAMPSASSTSSVCSPLPGAPRRIAIGVSSNCTGLAASRAFGCVGWRGR